jgi:hypothetical protein
MKSLWAVWLIGFAPHARRRTRLWDYTTKLSKRDSVCGINAQVLGISMKQAIFVSEKA